MQYLLTADEYDRLKNQSNEDVITLQKNLQIACTIVCDTKPIQYWGREDKAETPWGCILSSKKEWYCDECPVQNLCPNDNKQWSK